MARADLAAATLRSGTDDQRIELLNTLVQRIDLGEDSVSIRLCRAGVGEALSTTSPPHCDLPALAITVSSVRVRRGQQMRLIVPGPETQDQPPPVRRDDPLIALMAEALQARELVLAQPERSIAGIAGEHGRCRTRLSKLVAFSCMAPDIVTAILEGRQPETLTARKLTGIVLPPAWAQQGRVLGFE